MENKEFSQKLANCILHCNNCADMCLEEDNVKKMTQCIRLDHVCANACQALFNIHATKYQDLNNLVQFCMKVCGECADECEKHEHEHCQECAKACRECEEACKGLIG